MSTFERLTLSAYDDGPCPWPADVYRTALKAAYAEIDRLTAELVALREQAPVWNVITDDLRSYPRSGERVVAQLAEGAHHGIVARRGAVVEYQAECGVTETEIWRSEATGNQIRIRPGDRWTYIPEAQ